MPDRALLSSWEHCRGIALAAEEAGYDNLLLPSGYTMGIDSIAFAAGIAPLLRRMRLLVAVRMGEMWPPQLARQLATIDQMLGGRSRSTSSPRTCPARHWSRRRGTAARSRSCACCATCWTASTSRTTASSWTSTWTRRDCTRRGSPPFYFGGLSDAAREVAAQAADVYLMWPDTLEASRR